MIHSGKLTYLAGKWTRIEDVFPIEVWGYSIHHHLKKLSIQSLIGSIHGWHKKTYPGIWLISLSLRILTFQSSGVILEDRAKTPPAKYRFIHPEIQGAMILSEMAN